MGGNDREETKNSKRFANVRNIFRPRSRGTPNEPSDLSAEERPRSLSVDAKNDSQTAAPDKSVAQESSAQARARLSALSEAPIQGPTNGLTTSETPTNNSRSQLSIPRNNFVVPSDPYGDRKATEERYKTAAKQLEDALKYRRTNWKTFDIPTVSLDITTNDPIPQLREQIQSTLEARKALVDNRDFWEKGKNVVEQTFTAMSPFAKNFLVIAQHGTNVLSVQLFHR